MFYNIDIGAIEQRLLALCGTELCLASEIADFSAWQRRESMLDRLQLLRENAAIAYAAAEHGIVSLRSSRAAYVSPTGRLKQHEPEWQTLPTEEESDAERDRR